MADHSVFPTIAIKPHHWGPSAWTTFHYWTFGYPEVTTAEERNNYTAFFESFGNTIPCQSCRLHFQSLLKDYPPEKFMTSRSDLIHWGIFMHNKVNLRLGKPTMTPEEVFHMYEAKTTMENQRIVQKQEEYLPNWINWIALATGVGLCIAASKK